MTKKHAAFIGGHKIKEVYPASITDKLQSELCFPVPEILTPAKLEQYEAECRDVEYLFSTWGMPGLTEAQLERFFPRLRALFYAAGSVQTFARPFLARGVKVFSAWAANAVPVAEYTFAQITLANKGFFQKMHLSTEGSAWAGRTDAGAYTGNYETKIGIIGAGMIGKLVIRMLKTSMEKIDVLVFDPFLPDETAAELGVTKTDLHTLFSECSVISNHLANNAQTVGMLNGACFNRMSPCATFINTGRGAQVVEADLVAALEAEPGRTALLDVTHPEPPAADSPLYTCPGVILTPHIAGSAHNEIHRMAQYMYEEYRAFDAGEPVRFSVTEKMLETMA